MKHGELKDYITPGITSEEFHRRLQGAFHAVPPAAATPPPPAPEPPTLSSPQTTASSADGTSPAQPTEAQQSDTVRRVLAERAVRLQEQKLAAEQKIKEDRAKAKEKAEAESKAGKNTQAARTHQQAELVKKRKQQGIDERKRILKRIEDDKEERRAKAAEKDGRATVADVSASLTKSPETKIPSTTKLGNVTALQVRLFDGSTIRSRFKTAAPLADVRKWVGEDRTDGNMPFAFKQVVSPQANKLLDVTEEKKSLGDLALAPSATLVLIPVAKYTQAYQVGNGNILSQLIAMFIAVINWIGGLVGLGARPDAARASQSQEQELDDLNSQGRRRVPQNSNDRRDQQLYNGNSVSRTAPSPVRSKTNIK